MRCRDAEKAIDKAKAQRMAEFEAYVLGQKKSYDASIDELEALRKKHEALGYDIELHYVKGKNEF